MLAKLTNTNASRQLTAYDLCKQRKLRVFSFFRVIKESLLKKKSDKAKTAKARWNDRCHGCFLDFIWNFISHQLFEGIQSNISWNIQRDYACY